MITEEPITEEQKLEDGILELYTQSTVCDHFMVFEDDTTAICIKGCGHGCSIDKSTQTIINGKIQPLA
jgi:hypothetical protein